MKTPEEWIEFLQAEGAVAGMMELPVIHLYLIEAIQRDALSSPMAQTTDEQERQFLEGVVKSQEHTIKRLEHNIEVYKHRWHQARRYLRAANKGAERNNQVMRLQAHDISKLRERIKQLEQQLNNQ